MNTVQQTACVDACTIAADEWIANLSGCTNISTDPNLPNIKQAFINMCSNGCDTEHTGGASTPNPNNVVVEPVTGLTNPTIKQILAHFGYAESELCTELLISSPLPYDNTTSLIEDIVVPLDICGCDNVYQAEYDLANGTYPSGTTIEEVLALNTGVDLDDINHIICACEKVRRDVVYPNWVPGFVWDASDNGALGQLGIDIPANLSCPESQGCADCDEVNAEVSTLTSRFNVADFNSFLGLQNAEVILTNYLNDELNFGLNYTDYFNFISGL